MRGKKGLTRPFSDSEHRSLITMGNMHPHEEALIQAFIAPSQRRRFRELAAHPKRRAKLLRQLAHFQGLDERYVHRLPALPYSETVNTILKTLRERGAPPICYVMADDERDGRDMDLEEAVRSTVGRSFGTFLSCIPGRLGYFEGEGPTTGYILERQS